MDNGGLRRATVAAALAALLGALPSLTLAATRGPDAGGYTATDATVYSFVDLAVTGGAASILTGSDDETVVLALPFPFHFYGNMYDAVCVSSNGALYFIANGAACTGFVDFANLDLTAATPPGDPAAAFPYWSDLTFQVPGGGAVLYHTLGVAGSRRFVVQWNDAFPVDSLNPVTFQAVLVEGTNRILFQYRTVDLGDDNPASRGGAATIGIRAPAGLASAEQIQWSFNASVIPNESAVLFSSSGPVGTTIAWANPADIAQGTPLGSTQLNAAASAPGTLDYTPSAGTVLGAGSHTLSVAFTPADPTAYGPATATVTINVLGSNVSVSLLRPNGGETAFIGVPFPVRWSSTGASSFDLSLSLNGGSTFAPIANCTALPASATSCNWVPTMPSSHARVRVTARNGGATSVDESAANFTVTRRPPLVLVLTPHTSSRLTVGSTQFIRWIHTLGAQSYVRIELSRNGGATWETIADSVKNVHPLGGVFRWVVTGPTTNAAVVRVTWLDGTVTDSSGRFSIVRRRN
jgi:hypothetical protein